MRLLLTSAGIKNASIHNALVELLGKPIAECSALCIPTASYGAPHGRSASRRGRSSADKRPDSPMCELGWKSWACWSWPRCPASMTPLGSPGPGDRRPAGEWRRPHVPVLLDAAVRTGRSPAVAARGLGGAERREHGDGAPHRRVTSSAGIRPAVAMKRWAWLILSIFPHLDQPGAAGEHHGRRRKMGRRHAVPAYAMDDETAISVIDGAVEVVSEGHWKLFAPSTTGA